MAAFAETFVRHPHFGADVGRLAYAVRIKTEAAVHHADTLLHSIGPARDSSALYANPIKEAARAISHATRTHEAVESTRLHSGEITVIKPSGETLVFASRASFDVFLGRLEGLATGARPGNETHEQVLQLLNAARRALPAESDQKAA